MIEVKFVKTHPDAVIPTKAHPSDTGWDVYSVEAVSIPPKSSAVVPVGLTLGYITPGYWIRVESRSGWGFKRDIIAFNGIIDQDYRGDMGIKLFNLSDTECVIEKGTRIAQLVIYPLIPACLSETNEIHPSVRGANGFGSTGMS